MQEYFEPEKAFSIGMRQPVFEISIAYKKNKKKHVFLCRTQKKYFRLHFAAPVNCIKKVLNTNTKCCIQKRFIDMF